MVFNITEKYKNKYIKKLIKLELDNELTKVSKLSNVPGLNNFLHNLHID